MFNFVLNSQLGPDHHMTGYSNTPLAKKLGITNSAQIVAILNDPGDFVTSIPGLPAGITLHHAIRADESYDIIVCFAKQRTELEKRIGSLPAALQPNGGLWIAWPKKASKAPTDLSEDVIRDLALRKGLVDNKVCSINETWSGLRLVIPVAHRPKKARQR